MSGQRLTLVQRMARRIPSTIWAFVIALVIYAIAAGPSLARQSIAPHYVYLADALLHRHLDVHSPSGYDLLIFGDKTFVAGSPMPALLLLPLVAIFGVGISDILFGMIIAALNVALVHNMFHRWSLTLLFALGTPHLYLATLGTVWFNAHVVAILFGLLAVREALTQQRWWLAGLWLTAAGLARPTLMFGALFFVLLIVFEDAQKGLPNPGRVKLVLKNLIAFGSALLLGLVAQGLYNAARFGSPADFGYAYVNGAENITNTYLRYGGFNPRFLPCNLYVSLINPPQISGYVPAINYQLCDYLLDGINLSDTSNLITPNPVGMSVFIVTPALLLLFVARGRDLRIRAAWLGLLAIMIPLWMYHNTGSAQVGYRYWMDAAPMWLLLLSFAFDRLSTRGTRVARVLIVASIVFNVWGFAWMFKYINNASWFNMWGV